MCRLPLLDKQWQPAICNLDNLDNQDNHKRCNKVQYAWPPDAWYAAHTPEVDQQSAGIQWMGYGIIWVFCIFCGPVGPCLWFITFMVYCMKPKEVRDLLPVQAQVAKVTCITAAITLVIVLVVWISAFVAFAILCRIHGQHQCLRQRQLLSSYSSSPEPFSAFGL